MAKLNRKTTKGLLALGAVVAVASLVFGLTMQILPLSVSGTATSGAPVEFTVTGDEAPWDTTIVMTGKTVTATQTHSWDADVNTAGDAGPLAVDYYWAEPPNSPTGTITAPTLASGTFDHWEMSGRVSGIQTSGLRFRVFICYPATNCIVNTGDRYAVSSDFTSGVAGSPYDIAYTFTGTSALQGQTVKVMVASLCPDASPNCGTAAGFTPVGDTGVLRVVSQGSINPAVGSASYSGTLANGASTSELPITLALGSNSLAVTATGSGKVDYLIDYEDGVKPTIDSIDVSGSTITATATDANSDKGDSVTTYEFTLLREGTQEWVKTQTTASVDFNAVPTDYTVRVRAKDTRGVWSSTTSEDFTVAPTGAVQEHGETTVSAPSDAGDASASFGASADPGDFTRRTVVGWIRAYRWLVGDGFTDPTRGELPDWIENLAYGAA